MKIEPFEKLYKRAVDRKGNELALSSLLNKPLDSEQLYKTTNDRVLSAFTKKIFQSGFVWRVVENKWPDFEEMFFNFNIEKLLMMPDEMLEKKAQDPKIIRNYNKVKTIKANAQMIFEHSNNQQSFADMLLHWPSNDIIGLWSFLKKHGARLGGNTGPYALRALGVDTFLLSRDVEAYFRAHDLISGGLQSKNSLNTIQQTFNHWQAESGMSMEKLSRLIAYATGDNHVQIESDR